jgi:enoyl-CoA hydratase
MADTARDGPPPTDAAGEFVPGIDELLYERRGAVAIVTFNRPAVRNAMSWAMYQTLSAACEHVNADDRVRVCVFRGAGDEAFVAGTDISHFQAFSSEDDALSYERGIHGHIGRVEGIQKPTIAMIHGYCVGGGAAIALACDLRLASQTARFGMPMARTLGNTLAIHNVSRMVELLGDMRTKELLFTARLMGADEGKAVGLFTEVVEADRLEARALELAELIASHAPLTLRSIKAAVQRIRAHTRLQQADDLVLMCYMSEDFREGIAAFLEKRPARWSGR